MSLHVLTACISLRCGEPSKASGVSFRPHVPLGLVVPFLHKSFDLCFVLEVCELAEDFGSPSVAEIEVEV